MPRGQSKTHDLARFFVQEILGQEYSYQLSMRWNGEAKKLVNPPEDKGQPLDYDLVVGTLRALKRGMFGFDQKIESMWVITYGTPPYIQQYEAWVTNPPPFYNQAEVKYWEEITGRTAYENIEQRGIITEVPSIPSPAKSEQVYLD